MASCNCQEVRPPICAALSMPQGRPRTTYLVMTGAALGVLALLAFLATRNLALTLSFVSGSIAALALLVDLRF